MKNLDPLPPQLVGGLGVQLGILSQLYSGMMTRHLDGFDLTYPQFTLLMHLSRRSEPSRVSDLVAAVDLTQSAVTKAIQKFAKMGLVEVMRDSADQRNRPIRITDAGRRHLLQVQQRLGPAFQEMLVGWTPDEVGRLTADVSRLVRWLDAKRRET